MMNKKRIMSLVLAGTIAFSGMTPVYARTFSDVQGGYQEAIDVLSSLNIINGYEDGTYKPDKTITRAELAKLLVEALGYSNIAQGVQNNVFEDTQNHWAKSWITIANGLQLIKGDGNGKFRPDDTVTYDEAYTMVLRALGYTDATVKGPWPLNYKIKANELDLTDDVTALTAGADRGGVAQILYNALEQPLVKLNSDGILVNEYKDNGKTVKLLLDRVANYSTDFVVTPEVLDKDSKKYAGEKVDLSDYMYQTLTVYQNDDKEVIFVKDTNSLVVKGEIEKIDKDFIYIENEDGRTEKVALSDDVRAYFNGAETHDFDMTEMFDENEANPYEKLIIVGKDSNDNGKIDKESELEGLVIDQPTEVVVIENVYREGKNKLDTILLPTDKDNEVMLDKVVVTGAVKSIKDIKVDDVVVVYEAVDNDAIKLIVSRGNEVEGKVRRIDSADNKVTIGSKEYEVNKLAADVYNYSTESLRILLGDEGIFYLDHNGRIAGFDVESTVRANYGIVVGISEGTIKDGRFGSKVVDDYPYIKLATAEDDTEVFEVYVELDEDGSIDESALYDTTFTEREKDLLKVESSKIKFVTEAVNDLAKGQIIKYSVNKDGQIDGITLLREDTLTNVSTSSKSFELAKNAVIFKNDGKDYPLVRESYLDSRISGTGYYNNDGELEVILVDAEDVGVEADKTVIAYLESTSKIAKGYNDDDKIVQIPTLTVNGEEKEFFAISDRVFTQGAGVYSIEIEDEVIVKATLVTPQVAVVKSINSRGSNLELTIDGVTDWYYVSDEVTMVEIDGKEVEPIDIYDLDKGDTINVIIKDYEVVYVAIGDIEVPEVEEPEVEEPEVPETPEV